MVNLAIKKIIVDANVIVSALLRNAETRKILLSQKAPKFLAPEFLKEELNKYLPDFSARLKVKEEELEKSLTELIELAKIEILPQKEYARQMQKALQASPDKNDAHYFAIAMEFNSPLWSQDKKLKKQSIVKTYSTAELIEEMKKKATE